MEIPSTYSSVKSFKQFTDDPTVFLNHSNSLKKGTHLPYNVGDYLLGGFLEEGGEGGGGRGASAQVFIFHIFSFHFICFSKPKQKMI